MATATISEDLKSKLLHFLDQNKKCDLVTFYLRYIEEKFNIHPVLFPKEKTIYQSLDSLVEHLEKENKLCRETEIKIQFGQESVNENTMRIYICPFTGKVFGDNTHPNPQDAIYDWVASCPENTERINGIKVKRFYVSEDPEVIKSYISKRKEPITKIVFSSAITGKLFNSKKAVIDDFKKNHIKSFPLADVQNQNRFEIEQHFLEFLQKYLTEDKISSFVEGLSQYEEFNPYLEKWLES